MLYQTKNPHGGDIYSERIRLDYSANTNPYGTPQGVLDAMREVLIDVHHYPDPYCRKLTQAIAEYEGVPNDYILCGNGAAELIYSYCEALKPKRAVELAPTFSEYTLGLERVGCLIDRYVLHQEGDFVLDDGFLSYLEEKQPEVVFFCNPNNPTGQIIPLPLLERVLLFCRERDIKLFVDECFLDLSDGGASLKGWLPGCSNLFILKAFTKSYGMAGVRLGYCLSSNGDLLMRMSKTVQPWNVSMLAQAAGVAALGESAFLQKARTLIFSERQWLKDELERLGFWVCPAKANYLLFQGEPGLDTALRCQGIAIRNCDNYHGLGPGWYRIAVRLREENEQLMAAIRLALGKE